MGDIYKGLYIEGRIKTEEVNTVPELLKELNLRVGTVIMAVWEPNKSHRKKTVTVGLIEYIGNKYITVSEPNFNKDGDLKGKVNSTILFSDILSREAEVFNLGKL